MKRLERTLGLPYVVAISIAAMLGSGVFVLPGLASAKTGHSVWLAYLFAGLCVLPAALSKAEMATAMPTSGGTYVFIDRAFGPLAGTISGVGLWASLLLKSSFALVGFGAYLSVIQDGLPLQGTALVLLAAIVVMNLLGVRRVGKTLLFVVVLAVIGLTVLAVTGLSSREAAPPGRFFSEGLGGFFGATAFVFVSYAGVTKIAAVAGEVKNPSRNLPLAMLLSLGAVTILYTIVAFVLVDLMPLEELGTDLRPISSLGTRLFGGVGGIVFAVLGVLTMASMGNAGLLASSRFPFAMSRDDLAPRFLGHLPARFNTPMVSILATGIVMALAIAFLDVQGMAKLASAFKILMFTVVNVALIVLRESGAQWYRPSYRSPFYPAAQVFGILAGLVLLFVMGWTAPIAILACTVPGIGLYFAYGRRTANRTGMVSQLQRRRDLLDNGEEDAEPTTTSLSDEAAVAVALFGWERSPEALVDVGAALADGRKLEVLHLTQAQDELPPVAAREEEAALKSLRRRVEAMAEEQSIDLHFDPVVSRDLVKTAHEITSRLHCHWLVMSWRGRTALNKFLFLSPLGWLGDHLSSNLALYRDAGVRYTRRILVHPEPGPDDALVVRVADHLAERWGAELTFVRYAPDDTPSQAVQSEVEYLDQLTPLCRAPARSRILRGTSLVRALTAETAAHDLLVTNASPAGSLLDTMRGWDKDRIMEQSACSVLRLRTPQGHTHDDRFAHRRVAAASPEPFDLLTYIESRCVEAQIDVSRKDRLFAHVARAFGKALTQARSKHMHEALWKRERVQDTSVGNGVAIPHAMVDALDRSYVGVFTCAAPIPYTQSADDPVDVVFVVFGPPGDRQNHLLILSGISRLVMKTSLLAGLRAARTREELFAALGGAQRELETAGR